MNYRMLADGTIIFPKRGQPPPGLPGYDRDPGDPYIFYPSVLPCKHRVLSAIKLPCGKIKSQTKCILKNIIPTLSDCEKCKEREAP